MSRFVSSPSCSSSFAAHRRAAGATCLASNIGVTFALLLCALSGAGVAQATPQPGANDEAQSSPVRLAQTNSPEVTFWESVRDSEDPAEIEAYLETYPNGQFAPLARIRLDKLKQSTPTTAPGKGPEKPQAESSEKAPHRELGRQELSVKIGEAAGSKRGVLGVHIAAVTDGLAKSLGLANARGAFVTDVRSNSAAELAGIKPLDVIVEFDGREIVQMRQLLKLTEATPPGTEVRVVVLRPAKNFTEFAGRLRADAERGDAGAANSLGWLYATGAGTDKDEAEAVRWYRRAADQGKSEAMYQLGTMYANGRGVRKDDTEAVNWFRKAAEKNDAGALSSLGSMYETGRGVAKDQAEAARLYRKAADQGNSSAMFQLGVLYANGQGVPQDDAEAVIWWRRAADDDNAAALRNLGFMYQRGRGVFNDDAQAARLYRKAADLGDAYSMNNLGLMYQNGSGVAKDEAEAVRWYRKSADLGNAVATNNLGLMYEYGWGIAKDKAEAVRWYRKAADMGNAQAMHNLGTMYREGSGVAKDYAEAVRWYRKGADLGNADAMYNLGQAYDFGWVGERDPSAAAGWIFESIKAHSAFAVNEMTTNSNAWSKEFRRELQRRMKEVGAYDGKIDGEFGEGTKTAIEALAKQEPVLENKEDKKSNQEPVRENKEDKKSNQEPVRENKTVKKSNQERRAHHSFHQDRRPRMPVTRSLRRHRRLRGR